MKSNKNYLSESHNTLINASASAINSFEELNTYITDKDIAEKIINNSIDVSTLKLGEDYNICWYTIILKRNNRIVNNYIVPILIVKYYNYSNTPYYHMHAIPERVLECIYPAILSKNKKTIRTFFTPRVYSCDFSDVFFTTIHRLSSQSYKPNCISFFPSSFSQAFIAFLRRFETIVHKSNTDT